MCDNSLVMRQWVSGLQIWPVLLVYGFRRVIHHLNGKTRNRGLFVRNRGMLLLVRLSCRAKCHLRARERPLWLRTRVNSFQIPEGPGWLDFVAGLWPYCIMLFMTVKTTRSYFVSKSVFRSSARAVASSSVMKARSSPSSVWTVLSTTTLPTIAAP